VTSTMKKKMLAESKGGAALQAVGKLHLRGGFEEKKGGGCWGGGGGGGKYVVFGEV